MLLDSVDVSKIQPDDYGRYALLKSIVLDKNYIDVADDSLISVAENYYTCTSDVRSIMKCYHYHGRVYFNAERYPEGAIMFIKSLELAKSLHDDFWCGKNAEQLSYIYEVTYHGNDEIYYADMAADYYRKSKKRMYLMYAILSQSRANLNNHNYSKAISYAEMAKDSAMVCGNTDVSIEADQLMAHAFYGLGKYGNVVGLLEPLYKKQKIDAASVNLLATAYLETNDMEKADGVINKCNYDNSPSSIMLRYKLAYKMGNYKEACDLQEKLVKKSDDILGNSLNQRFNQLLSDLYGYEHRVSELKVRETKVKQFIVIIVLGCIIAFLAIISALTYRKQRRRAEKNIAVAQNLRDILCLRNNQFSEAQKNIRNLLETRFKEVDSLCRKVYEHKNTKSLRTKISTEIDRLISDMSSNDARIMELETFVNSNYSDVMSKFRCDLPNLKRADYLLFLYSILGFSIGAIALFLNEEKLEAVYNRKARLKHKIKSLNSENARLYLDALA